MKKSPTIILAAVLILLACAPQAATAQGRPSGVIKVSVKGDRLAFASIADYKRAVDEPSDETKEQFARTVAALKGFASFAQAQNSSVARQGPPGNVASLIQDEYFASILNANLVVQIGDHILRVNPSAERVYVLSAANEKEYDDLVAENPRNSNIRTFSTNDDVLEELQGGGKGPQTLCSQSGIGGRHREVQVQGSQKANADFARYGIYFTLFGWVPDTNSSFPFTFDFTGGIGANQGYVYYHVRCGNTVSYAISAIPSVNNAQQKYQSYQGSKNLNEVYFFYRLKFHPIFWVGPSFPLYSPYVGFRVNK